MNYVNTKVVTQAQNSLPFDCPFQDYH